MKISYEKEFDSSMNTVNTKLAEMLDRREANKNVKGRKKTIIDVYEEKAEKKDGQEASRETLRSVVKTHMHTRCTQHSRLSGS